MNGLLGYYGKAFKILPLSGKGLLIAGYVVIAFMLWASYVADTTCPSCYTTSPSVEQVNTLRVTAFVFLLAFSLVVGIMMSVLAVTLRHLDEKKAIDGHADLQPLESGPLGPDQSPSSGEPSQPETPSQETATASPSPPLKDSDSE